MKRIGGMGMAMSGQDPSSPFPWMVARAAIFYYLLYLDVSSEVQGSVPYLATRKHTPTYREADRLLLRTLGRGSLVMCLGRSDHIRRSPIVVTPSPMITIADCPLRMAHTR